MRHKLSLIIKSTRKFVLSTTFISLLEVEQWGVGDHGTPPHPLMLESHAINSTVL